jgi:hypothetical protein
MKRYNDWQNNTGNRPGGIVCEDKENSSLCGDSYYSND